VKHIIVLRLLFAAVLAGLAAGCSDDPTKGYSTAGLHRDDVESVAVPIWKRANPVYRREIETRLTEALVKRIQLDTPYKVTDKSKADTILEGTLVNITQRVMSFNPDTGSPRDIEVQLTVDYKWTDLRTGEVLVEKKGFRAAAVYYPPEPLSEDFFEGSEDAVNRLAEQIVETMERPW
jgi:hypothetical protein